MERTYKLLLTPLQLDVLLETVRGFVDNKKLLHVPTAEGEIVGLPLTEEALAWLVEACGETEEKQTLIVRLTDRVDDRTEVTVQRMPAEPIYTYEVQLSQFDEQ
ncbi:hypothetical protein JQN58_07525 [Aneurinibacillus sp. BA2021]|nr:hypothetical protein [Aneurinibacillus sp. BA2021]